MPSLFNIPLHISHEKWYLDAVLSGHSSDSWQIFETDLSSHQKAKIDGIELTENINCSCGVIEKSVNDGEFRSLLWGESANDGEWRRKSIAGGEK